MDYIDHHPLYSYLESFMFPVVFVYICWKSSALWSPFLSLHINWHHTLSQTYKIWKHHQIKFWAWKCIKFGYNIAPMYCFNGTWTEQSSPGHHQELDWEQEKHMLSLPASLQWTNSLLITSLFVWNMWHDHPGKFVLTLLNVLIWQNCLLWPVIQDPVLVSAYFSFVNESNNWLFTFTEAIH